MTTNIMETYIKYVKNFIKDFTKMFFENSYIDSISNEYIYTYIDSRFYNIREEEGRYFYTTIYSNLTIKSNYLKRNNERIYHDYIDKNLKLYQFIFYIDNIRSMPDINSFVKTICNKRLKEFGLSDTPNIDKKFLTLIKDFFKFKTEFFNSYNSEDFVLDIKKIPLIDKTYKVTLKYTFKIPYMYSNRVVDEVFNTGTINEDKNLITYTLLTMECIKDINNCNFDKKYIVDFASSLYKKTQKLNQTLRVFNNVSIQDKIIIRLLYKDFEKYKDEIISLIGDGYKFAIELDDKFEASIFELRKLDIFEYIIVNKGTIIYDSIQDYENNINNIVIYEY